MFSKEKTGKTNIFYYSLHSTQSENVNETYFNFLECLILSRTIKQDNLHFTKVCVPNIITIYR